MENKISRVITHLSNYQRILLDRKFASYNFGSGQYPFFLTIAANEGLNQKEISAILQVNKATTNKAIKKLEELGYVKTLVDQKDRRLHCVYLTEEGQKIRPDIQKLMDEHNAYLRKSIDDETFEIMYKALITMEEQVFSDAKRLKEEKNNE